MELTFEEIWVYVFFIIKMAANCFRFGEHRLLISK